MGDHATHQRHESRHVDDEGPRKDDDPQRTTDADNLALQTLLRSGALHAKLRVGASSDPAEVQADSLAQHALAGPSPPACTCSPGAPPCASCRDAAMIRRRAIHDGAVTPTHSPVLGLGSGRRLGDTERAFFEARMQRRFDAVRVHDDERAIAAADRLDARAFTLGTDIGFARGEYQPASARGRELLAHELAHVAQGDAQTVRREPRVPAKTADPANPEILELTGTLDERKHAFKQLVKTTAVHRLLANQRNLKLWELLVQRAVPATDLAALGLQQSGGTRPYFELQDIRDPGVRELRAEQAKGRFRACTGCHIETQLSGSRQARESQSLTQWASPNEIRFNAQTKRALADAPGNGSGASGSFDFAKPMPTRYQPPTGSAEAELDALFPDPVATSASLTRIQPIVDTLGPSGYDILGTDILPLMIAGKPDAVRCAITAAIDQRYADFGKLIDKIQANDVGWEHFAPVIRTLLPVADAEVRAAIQKEMDDNAFWQKVEAVVVGILTVAALLLTIFPPTTALGLAAVAALDLTLAHYGITKGAEMVRIGEIYGLGKGAHDVFTPAQQSAADSMVLGGWISMVGGVLQGVGGLARLNQLARMGPPAVTTLAVGSGGSVGRIIQQGDYVMSVAQDGAIYVTVASRPDLVIMARGNTATLYQVMEGGGMRALATATLPGDVAAPAAAPLLLAAGTEAGASSTALVPGQSSALTMMRSTAGEADVFAPAASAPRVLITPPPREPLQLSPGAPTTYTWGQVSRMRQPNLWQEREIYMQQLYGSPGQRHFPVPDTGGRYTDVPVQLPSGQLFAGEVKSYTRWITAEGQAQRNAVDLTTRIEEQIRRDVWLRDNYPGYDPRWMFTDAPPTEALRQALRDARIVFIEYLH